MLYEQILTPLTHKDIKEKHHILLIEEVRNLADLIAIKRHKKEESALVVILSVDEKMKNSARFRQLTKGENVRQYCWHIATFADRYRAEDEAYNAVEDVYDYLLKRRKVPAHALEKLYLDKDVSLVYKKELIAKICQYYRLVNASKVLQSLGQNVLLFPTVETKAVHQWIKAIGHTSVDDESFKKIKCVFTKMVLTLHYMREKCKALIQFFAISPWIFTQVKILRSSKGKPEEFQCAVRLYKSGWGFNGEGTHEDDWILDGKTLNPENTYFVAENALKKNDEGQVLKRGYRLIHQYRQTAFKECSFGFIVKEVIAKALSCALPLWFSALRAPTYFVKMASLGWLHYLMWSNFLQMYRPKCYFGCHDILYSHLFRNSLLSQVNCKTVYFDHSNSKIEMYEAGRTLSGKEALRAYIKFDKEIHWGDQLIELEKKQYNQSKSFVAYGPIWTDDVKESRILSQIIKGKWGQLPQGLIFAAFSTTNSVTAINSEHAHRQFLSALENILSNQDFPNAKIIYKPKHPGFENYMGWEGTDIGDIFNRLKDHPRFLLLDPKYSFSRTIYYADMTITMAFASTTMEALMARRPAIYYDGDNDYPYSYFEKFPNIVAHDGKNLKTLIKHWLNISDEELESYVRTHIVPEYGGKLEKKPKDLIREGLINHAEAELSLKI